MCYTTVYIDVLYILKQTIPVQINEHKKKPQIYGDLLLFLNAIAKVNNITYVYVIVKIKQT